MRRYLVVRYLGVDRKLLDQAKCSNLRSLIHPSACPELWPQTHQDNLWNHAVLRLLALAGRVVVVVAESGSLAGFHYYLSHFRSRALESFPTRTWSHHNHLSQCQSTEITEGLALEAIKLNLTWQGTHKVDLQAVVLLIVCLTEPTLLTTEYGVAKCNSKIIGARLPTRGSTNGMRTKVTHRSRISPMTTTHITRKII